MSAEEMVKELSLIAEKQPILGLLTGEKVDEVVKEHAPHPSTFWHEVILRLVMELAWTRRDVRIQRKAVKRLRAELGTS